MSDRIVLNVGGQLFETTRSTLVGLQGDSMLAKLVAFPRHDSDADTPYFIDRDPTLFKPILQYLRSGTLTAPSGVTADIFRKELAFYGLDDVQVHGLATPVYFLIIVEIHLRSRFFVKRCTSAAVATSLTLTDLSACVPASAWGVFKEAVEGIKATYPRHVAVLQSLPCSVKTGTSNSTSYFCVEMVADHLLSK